MPPSRSKKTPASEAIARAVTLWSPVIITTLTPASRALRIASGTSGRSPSFTPKKPTNVRPLTSSVESRSPEKYHSGDLLSTDDVRGLTFVGFLGMKDGLRPEVPDAMRKALDAGVKVVMITGDHKVTALAIASEAGIFHDGEDVITGDEMNELSDYQLTERIGNISVFARMTPEHKLRIIKAYKSTGLIIAMTGDGVNDAPSLVAADLGVAMGGIGTEVAKEASDIVLLDDNFGSIVSAIEEGRGIYKAIKKVILYLFSTNASEIFVLIGALLLALPLPLLPSQIIWLNFVTDPFLDVSLAMEPKEKGLLKGTFEHPRKYLIDALMAHRIPLMAVTMAGIRWAI